MLEAAAPGHVESVRRNLVDLLTPAEIATLETITAKVVRHLDAARPSPAAEDPPH